MKRKILSIMLFASFMSLIGCNNSTDPATWSTDKIDDWFEKGEWLNGWTVTPDPSIDRKKFVLSYFKNKDRWDKAFTFLAKSDLPNLEVTKYALDGDNLFATVSEYLTRNDEDVDFEAHRKYIDIQYIIMGNEHIGISDVSGKQKTIVPYDTTNDIEFMTIPNQDIINATPENFVIFFPSDAHRPCLKVDENSNVRKIVIKVKVD